MKTKKALSYRDAGVDIEEADALVDQIKGLARGTRRKGVLGGIGGFGALFELGRYRSPVLVSGTDGVGTKLKLAIELNRHNTIGIDLVAMCVNDILTTGAEPLFFLDYYATGKLNAAQAKTIIAGISEGCHLAQAALIGGETAEMPGLYQKDDYDLAGFCVGVVEKKQIIDGAKKVRPGDALIALASSGPHSNGYSLIRKILKRSRASLNQRLGKSKLSDLLLMPTRIYVQSILKLQAKMKIHAIAHITGGGLLENIPRVLPPRTQAVLVQNSWEWPEIFHWIQSQGNVATTEMQRTFNLGVGMVLCVPKNQVKKALNFLKKQGEKAWLIGKIETSKSKEPRVVMR